MEKQVTIRRYGKQPLKYKCDSLGRYYRFNHRGRWVRLHENYPQHAQALRAARVALGRFDWGAT